MSTQRGVLGVVSGLVLCLLTAGCGDPGGGADQPEQPTSPTSETASPSRTTATGKVVGRSVTTPSGLVVHIEISRGSGRVPGSVSGWIVVQNPTGKVVSVADGSSAGTSCGPAFGLALSSTSYRQELAYTADCKPALRLAPGTTRMPVSIVVDAITSTDPKPPPGTYRVGLQGTDKFGAPPSVPFVVTD